MDSETAVVAIITAVITVGGTLLGIMLRNSRKSPETKDAQTNAWGAINDRVNKQLDWLTAQVTSLRGELSVATALIAWLRARNAQLVKFINDSGKTPPDPPSSEPGA